MAKGKQNKQPSTSSAPAAAGAAEDATGPEATAAPGGSPYDREPEAGGGALVFLGIIGVLLAGAVLVGLLQG
ncbi:MAG: hypothetical protein H6725_07425 [Sandaracinaceae bacterium]|nr:hypothetical protein [Sandaracinaceae bacterium]